jgi:hypothetical protein
VDVDGGQVTAATLEHDPESRVPVFLRDVSGTRLRGDHAQIEAIERDDDDDDSGKVIPL